MSDENRVVDLVCPACKKIEQTSLDADEPQNTASIEIACPTCLDADEALSSEPVFKDKHGLRLKS